MTSPQSCPDFARDLQRFGDAPAIVSDGGQVLSYAALAAAADAFAGKLAPAVRVLLVEGCNASEAVIAYLGGLRSGRTVLLHSEGLSAAESSIVRTFRPDAIYARSPGGWSLTVSGGSTACHPDLALLLSTSGSTGAAKLVRLSGNALAANARAIGEYLELGPAERPVTALPISYSYGLSVLNSHLAVGAAILLTDKSIVDDAFWDFAGREGATSLAGVPHSFELLERGRLLDRAPATLRTLTQAGGRLAPEKITSFADAMERRGGRLFVMYGQTEATARISYVPPELLAANPGCIGIAVPGGTLHLRDDDGGVISAPGRIGELIYRGPNVMMGYATDPADLARGAELAELATGDLAEITASGLFRIAGRLSRFVKPFGLRIALDEVERMLEADGLKAMVAGSDSLIAVALLRPEDGGATPADCDAIAARLAQRCHLPPAIFRVCEVDQWPRLASGKLDYQALLGRAQATVAVAGTADPVADIFARYLPARKITQESSFTGLEGDSLNYVNLAMALEEALGVLPNDWADLTVAELEALRFGADRAGLVGFIGIDGDIVLRAFAIASVVGNHASDRPVGGGATALIMLVGYNWARFQRRALGEGQVAPIVRRLVTNILLPFYAIVLAYGAWKSLSLSSLLLVSNWDPALHGLLLPFWFISAYVQVTLLVAGLAALCPPVRRSIREAPWRSGLVAFGISIALMIALNALGLSLKGRSLDQVLPLVTLGWCLVFAGSFRRKAVAILAAALFLLVDLSQHRLFSSPTIDWSNGHLWLAVTTVLLLFVPRIVMPRLLAKPVVAVAAATYTIYLTHTFFIWTAAHIVGHEAPGLASAAAAILGGVALHIGGYAAFRAYWTWRKARDAETAAVAESDAGFDRKAA